MSRIAYAPDLVEQAVLAAERVVPADQFLGFRRERDRIYLTEDDDRREAGFRALHQRWFARLALHRTIETLINDRSQIFDQVAGCRVSIALTRRDEGADLIDPSAVTAASGDTRPMIVIRLRPTSLLQPAFLQALLAHELMHVQDMLDPAFAYERTLPASDDGPSGETILRERYRVLWDVTIDGRLARAGAVEPATRVARAREFAETFAMLGDEGPRIFAEWFDRIQPTHPMLVAFGQAPFGGMPANRPNPRRCPLCRFPVGSLDPRPERLAAAVEAMIRVHHPGWSIELGLCSQCLDLYEARHAETCGISC